MKVDYIFDAGSSKEDAYLVKDNLFAVFDGFNSLDGFVDTDGTSGGLVAATIAKNIFSRNEGSLKDLALEANRKIREKMVAAGVDVKNKCGLWGAALAVVRIGDGSFEWVQLADSLILLIYADTSHQLLVEDFDHEKEVLTTAKRLAAERNMSMREVIDAGLHTELRSKANETYGALNGEEAAANFLNSGNESLRNVKHILLFTDGLMLPREDPQEEHDWKLFVDLFLQGGLEHVKNYVRDLQNNDPKCWKYPRYKQHDDIAALSLTF